MDSLQSYYRALSLITQNLWQRSKVNKAFPHERWIHSFSRIVAETDILSSDTNSQLAALIENRNYKKTGRGPNKFWSTPPTLISKSSGAKNKIIASRRFYYLQKPVILNIFAPEKMKCGYHGKYEFVGISPPKSIGSLGEDPFQAIYLSYFLLSLQLGSLGRKLRWELAPEQGQHGLPLCLLSAESYDNDWYENFRRSFGEMIQRL
jgi:hypothetical protein